MCLSGRCPRVFLFSDFLDYSCVSPSFVEPRVTTANANELAQNCLPYRAFPLCLLLLAFVPHSSLLHSFVDVTLCVFGVWWCVPHQRSRHFCFFSLCFGLKRLASSALFLFGGGVPARSCLVLFVHKHCSCWLAGLLCCTITNSSQSHGQKCKRKKKKNRSNKKKSQSQKKKQTPNNQRTRFIRSVHLF